MDQLRRGPYSPQSYDHRDNRQPHPPPPQFAPPAHPASHAPQQNYRPQAPPYSQQPQQPEAPPPHQQSYQQQHQQPPPPQHHPPQQHAAGGPQLPPIQPAGYPPPVPPSSSDSRDLPPFRPSSAQPPHEQSREGPQQYQSEHSYNRSGHATPAPTTVNRSYSHDSGQQRTPATPTGPTHFPPPSGHDGAQQPPPGAPPPPPHPMEHGGHHGYPPTNGVSHHGLPPPPPTHAHHDQHPQYAMTPIMDQHHQYPPPGQAPMYSGPPNYGPTATMNYGPKRKQMRATQACEQCRQRKQKCDEGQPCSFCKENNLNCQYRDTPPAKTDKNMEKLLASMELHTQGLQALTSKIETFEARLRIVEQNTRSNSHSHAQTYSQQNNAQQSSGGAEQDSDGDDDDDSKESTEDHRTAPHKLLMLWPTVRPLLQAAGVAHSDSYVMEAEDRGVLRLWTRGEGIDDGDGTGPGTLNSASPARSEDSNDVANAGTPFEGLWGTGFPSTSGSNNGRLDAHSHGGFKSNGQLDLDAHTINQLYDSYIMNIHIMHPFLDKRRLRKMLEVFTNRYSTGSKRAAFAVGNDYSNERPLKRQRSNGSGANNVGGGTGSDSDAGPQPTERSPGNAIIYLVLALGKICLHKQPLPGMVPNSKLETNAAVSHSIAAQRYASSPMSTNVKQSPMSPNSTPITQPTPPSEAHLRRHESRSRRSSVDDSPSADLAGQRNLDVIPGMAYYARAAEIMGDQGDGNDLVHAQMFLLAGLYKGQLARVKESMSWFTMAGRAIQILLDRYKLYNGSYWKKGIVYAQFQKTQSRIKDTRQALIVMASWSCLQLETDILAELRLPASGIRALEGKLLMPHRVNEDESYSGLELNGRADHHDSMLIFYSAQLFLRRRLNKVHKHLYGSGLFDKSLDTVLSMLAQHNAVLEDWRSKLPLELQWTNGDDPPQEILHARLRAKYWGARYVVNRPFLDYVLHILPHVNSGITVEAAAVDGYGAPRDPNDVTIFKAIRLAKESEIWSAARACIYAAEQSTVAFDSILFGLGERLIVTNIHGTAHAQFGNMLVLCAVYNTDWVKDTVDPEKLSTLLTRTIRFLRTLSPISPTCKIDCGILEKFQNHLFPMKGEAKTVYKEEGVEPNSAETSFQGSFNGSAAR